MNLNSFDLNLLLVLDQLMDKRSVTKTAQSLGVTQSSVSSSLNRLRAVTKDRLLERQGNTMVPTKTAEAMWPDIQTAITAIQGALSGLSTFVPREFAGTFRIAMDEYATLVLGPAVCQRLLELAPLAVVEITPVRLPDSAEALSSGAADVAVGATWTELKGLKSQLLFEEEFVCLSDAKRGPKTPLTLKTYLQAPHLLLSTVGLVQGNVDAALAKRNLSRRVGVVVPYLAAVPGILIGSNLVFNTGQRVAKHFTALSPLKKSEIPLAVANFKVSMAWHPRNATGQAHRWLRGLIAEVSK